MEKIHLWTGACKLRESARLSRMDRATGAHGMHYVGGALAIAAGLFSSAGLLQLGSSGAEPYQYGATLCDKPLYLLVAAGLAAAWGAYVSVR